MVIGFFVQLVAPWPLFMVVTTKYRGNQLTAGVLRACSPAGGSSRPAADKAPPRTRR
jgi:hypothetical protein